MHRHQLTDEQWVLVEPFVPQKSARTGRPAEDAREMLDGILWTLRTGAPWRDLPERFGPWKTGYDYFSHWRKSGGVHWLPAGLQTPPGWQRKTRLGSVGLGRLD